MAQKSPAFQFYPKDFLSDGNVSQMSLQELGAYMTLLCLCWIEGSLPTDTQRLANMVGVPARVFLKLWPAVRACFIEQDGRLLHPRLEREREKQEQYRRRQSDAGRASAATRRQPEPNRGSTTVQPPFNQTLNQTATTGQPEPNSPISYLHTPVTSTTPSEDSAAVLTFACEGSPPTWALTRDQVATWQALFPSLEVQWECARAYAWLEAAPARRKTAKGMARFLLGWLNRSQERLVSAAPAQKPTRSYTPTAHADYDAWPSECARLHGGTCAHYQAHQLRLAKEAAA